MWGWLDWARSWERIARESVISSLIFPPQPPPCSLTLLTSTVQDHPDICTVLWILISYLLSPTLRIQQVLHSALSRPPRSLIMQTPENTELDIIRLAPLTATTSSVCPPLSHCLWQSPSLWSGCCCLSLSSVVLVTRLNYCSISVTPSCQYSAPGQNTLPQQKLTFMEFANFSGWSLLATGPSYLPCRVRKLYFKLRTKMCIWLNCSGDVR